MCPPLVPSWWRLQMETFSSLLAICAGKSPVPGEFPAQMPVKQSFNVFFDLRLNKRLSKQSWGWWFETPPFPLWRHYYGYEAKWNLYKATTKCSDLCKQISHDRKSERAFVKNVPWKSRNKTSPVTISQVLLSTFRCSGLSTFRASTFRLVDVSVCRRLVVLTFQSAHWLAKATWHV